MASHYFQFLSSHASIGSYLAERTHTISSSACWCGSGKQQSGHHLFVQCRAWTPRSESCGRASRRPATGNTRERRLPGCSSKTSDPFLQGTKIGRMVTLTPEEDWEELEEVVLWLEGGGRTGRRGRGGRVWPAPRMQLSFVFYTYSFILSLSHFFGRIWEERDRKAPLGRQGTAVAQRSAGRGYWDLGRYVK